MMIFNLKQTATGLKPVAVFATAIGLLATQMSFQTVQGIRIS